MAITDQIVPFHKDVGHAAAQHARLDQPPQDGVLAPFHIHPAQRWSGGALLRHARGRAFFLCELHARRKGFLSERVADYAHLSTMLRDVPSPRMSRKAAASTVRTRMREFCSESVGPRPFVPCTSVVCRCNSRELPTLFAVHRVDAATSQQVSDAIRRHQTPSTAISHNQPTP